ncbi:carbonic anhydrase [Streptomyces sp. CC228A]|uniref:carbonic anhydrase n=1 Tax=Streptomyces sp. CC228A TaxID=2898186 RepID=UPI001F483C72|nr:carbonic anhydrase [Streptomyces sp. CC228A]
MRTALAGGAVLAGTLSLATAPTAAAPRPAPRAHRPRTPADALRELARGNHRWATRHQSHPHEATADRTLAVSGQHPFALVLGCVDSRVPPELVFDQGLGDLMTVRSAGCVLDEAVLGSIAFGVLELDIPLVLVLGHTTCGAVTAAVRADETHEPLPAHISYLADRIRPAVDRTLAGEERTAAAIDTNIRLVRAQLAAEPDLAARVTTGRLAIAGARYDLHTQRVRRLPSRAPRTHGPAAATPHPG